MAVELDAERRERDADYAERYEPRCEGYPEDALGARREAEPRIEYLAADEFVVVLAGTRTRYRRGRLIDDGRPGEAVLG